MSRKARKRSIDRSQKNYALDSINSKVNLELNHIDPLTKNQELAFKAYPRKHLFLYGTAGTGKSFLGSYLSFKDILSFQSPYKKLIIVRSAVQTRDIGHMPGNDKEKMKHYEPPYQLIFSELFGRGDAYEVLKKKGLIEFISTSFIRGITISDAVILVDECQNLTAHEMHSVITRVGKNCKIIFAGDIKQVDLNKRKELSGVSDFIKIIKKMNCFEFIHFQPEDIVRGPLVKSYIITKEELEERGEIAYT